MEEKNFEGKEIMKPKRTKPSKVAVETGYAVTAYGKSKWLARPDKSMALTPSLEKESLFSGE